jgi:signal transduction histidine kinase
MHRLYWKIVLIEGLLLILIIGVAIWAMGLLHREVESHQQQEKNAAIELLRIGLRNDLPQEVTLANLEGIASHIFKSHVEIVASDSAEPAPGPNEIHFRQNGIQYRLLVSDSFGHRDSHKGFASLFYEKYVVILLFLAVALSLLAIPLARIVTKPLRELKQDMRQFASGDLSHRTKVTSKDEVGDVARDFNEMADSIQSLIRVGKEMTAHASHELRSPLTRIDVARQVLEEHATSRQLEMLDSIREEIEGMDALIDKILRLSRLDLNKSKSVSLCFVKIGSEAVRRYIDSFSANDIHFVNDFPGNLPGVGVIDDIVCLVDNLLNNALKFTPRGGNVEIALRQESDGILLSVSNDAQKPAFDIARLIEPFQRGGVSESIPGSGLGLAIANRIVENHNGIMSILWHNGKFFVSIKFNQGNE